MTLPVLHLVSCVSVKLDRAAPARDLYCSQWFKFARSIVDGEPWAILSAKHGLIWPDTVIEPYDETLIGKSRDERAVWAARVLAAMPHAVRYVIWAGRRYAEFLVDPLSAELPLRGMGIGQQLAFMKSLTAK